MFKTFYAVVDANNAIIEKSNCYFYILDTFKALARKGEQVKMYETNDTRTYNLLKAKSY